MPQNHTWAKLCREETGGREQKKHSGGNGSKNDNQKLLQFINVIIQNYYFIAYLQIIIKMYSLLTDNSNYF